MTDIDQKKKELEHDRAILREYLLCKFHSEDWHGVQDSASDLRDIDAALAAISYTVLKIKGLK